MNTQPECFANGIFKNDTIKALLKGFLFIVLLLKFTDMTAQYDPNLNKEVSAHSTPNELKDLDVKENLGGQIDLTLDFIDDKGHRVALGQYFRDEKPVLMTIVYYNCPSLCNYHLNGLLEVFKKMKMVAGKDFRLLAISMNHNESWDVASKKKKNYLDTYGVDGAEDGWSFLVGTETNVKKITNQLGFQFRWDEKTKQYAHPAVAYIMTPRGKISRYLYGIEFSPKTLRLSLVEAAEAKIGDVVDKLLLYCFKFNPEKSVYTIYSYNIMRIAGGFTVIIVALFIFPIWFRERKKKNKV